jgi:hypothetical protein
VASLVKPLTLAEVTEEMKRQLSESGLSPKQRGYLPLISPPDKLTSHPAPGYQITYHDRAGKPTKFYRYRYVKSPVPFGKPLRYVQPSNVLPQVYWSLEIPWKEILADKDIPLFITEGEKKADCGCKNGFATIGLGGVWNFKSRTIELIAELVDIDWENRRVYIVYDSDAISNPSVLLAERRLGEQLLSRKAIVLTVRLPEGSDKKVAMDDFIVANGAEEFQRLLDDAEEFESSRALHAMNEEVCYIENPSAIIKLENRQVMSCREFVTEAFYPRTHTVMEGMPKGGEKPVVKRTAKEWLGWTGRARVTQLTYAPGQPLITAEKEWNRWRGWGTEPKQGSVKRWTELLDFIFKDAGAEQRKWFEQWLAYPIQNPGAKLFSAVLVWGYVQRTGKSLVGYTMEKIYGDNFREIGSDDLGGNFNPWAEDKQFIMGDEIATAEESRKTIYNRLKRWITQPTITINKKYVPTYVLPDRTNYYFTSNNPDAFYVDEEDARLLVIEVRGEPKEKAFYNEFVRWRDAEGGASAIMDHLLRLDLSGFDPSGPPPDTQAKSDMKSGSRSAAEKWVEALTKEPAEMLSWGKEQFPNGAKEKIYNLYTIQQLVKIAQSHTAENERRYITTESLGKALRKHRFEKVDVPDGRIKIAGEGFVYVWNIGKKKLKTADEIRDHYKYERTK